MRPLASSSLDGARHMLRDDPELRLELRDRLHRARLDRRKNNDNPLSGSDPDAPDWFEPDVGGGNGAAEITLARTRGTDEREEGLIVPIDDRSPNDDTRGSTSSGSDGEADLIEASREPEDTDEPEFNGDVPGFTDWREELRERLKRIRARRKQEAEDEARRAAEATEAKTQADERAEESAAAAVADADDVEAADEVDEDDVVDDVAADEDNEEVAAAGEEDEDGDDDEVAAEDKKDDDDEVAAEDKKDDDLAAEDEKSEDDDVSAEDEEDDEVAAEDEDDEDAVEVEETLAARGLPRPAVDKQPDEASGDDDEDDDAPAPATAKDLIAQLVDRPGRDGRLMGKVTVLEDEVDFVIERDKNEAADEREGPEALILGEKGAARALPREDDDGPDLELITDEEHEKAKEVVDDDLTLDLGDDQDQDEDEDDDPTLELDETDENGDKDEDDEDDDPTLELDDDAGESDEEELAAGPIGGPARPPVGFDWGDAAIPTARKPAMSGMTKEDRETAEDSKAKEKKAPAAKPDAEREAAAAKEEVEETAAGARKEVEDKAAGAQKEVEDKAAAAGAASDDESKVDTAADRDASTGADKAAAEEKKPSLPPVVMPDRPGVGSAPELDFEPPPGSVKPGPEIDLPTSARSDEASRGLEWDADTQAGSPLLASSAAPLGERAAASVCDALVLVAIGAALVGAASSGTEVPFRQILVEETLWLALAWAIFAVGYSIFLVGACGQTFGRMVMRLRVIGDDQFSVGFDRAAIRLAAWVVSAVPALAGMLPALKDPQRRALHDRLSHTRVVKA